MLHYNKANCIKVYADTWNQIPKQHRLLFMELALRMAYQNTIRLTHDQMVYTMKPYADQICEALGWKYEKGKTSDSLMKGLRILCKCGAIKKVGRAVYQINPSYARKGK